MNLTKGKRIVGNDRVTVSKKIISLYKKGDSIRQIADEIGRSYGFVHRLLSENTVSLRSQGGSHTRKVANV